MRLLDLNAREHEAGGAPIFRFNRDDSPPWRFGAGLNSEFFLRARCPLFLQRRKSSSEVPPWRCGAGLNSEFLLRAPCPFFSWRQKRAGGPLSTQTHQGLHRRGVPRLKKKSVKPRRLRPLLSPKSGRQILPPRLLSPQRSPSIPFLSEPPEPCPLPAGPGEIDGAPERAGLRRVDGGGGDLFRREG